MDRKSLSKMRHEEKRKVENKREKRSKGEEGRDKNGIITTIWDLPEDILLEEIMSKLHIKEAIRTSVLSKRWVDRWLNMSKIELIEFNPERRLKFINFVERVHLIFKSLKLHPKKFTLKFEVGEDSAIKINRWLSSFVKPNIKELMLYLDLDKTVVVEPLVFPDHLFTSQKLIKFDLTMPHVLNLPSTIDFKSLKSLTLKYVYFPNTSSTQKLFSSFPSLEELTLIDCNWIEVTNVCISCPLLDTLIIKEWREEQVQEFELEQEHEQEEVQEENDAGDHQNNVAPASCQITIFAPNLQTFSYHGDLSNDYFLFDTKSIVYGAIETYSGSTQNAAHFVYKLLVALTNVEMLNIIDLVLEALSVIPSLITSLPWFHNLVEFNMISIFPLDFSDPALLGILRKSPHLKEVQFSSVFLTPTGENNVGQLPTCFETHLKKIVINYFNDNQGELYAIKYFLQKALILDTLVVTMDMVDLDLSKERVDELYDMIEEFPRASVNCKIKFERE